MGRRHGDFQYPQVPVQASNGQHLNESVQPRAQQHSRFSWIDTPVEAERRRYTQNVQTTLAAPPLPVMPNDMNQHGRIPQRATDPQYQTEYNRPQQVKVTEQPHTLQLSQLQPQIPACDKKENLQKPDAVKTASYESRSLPPIAPDENPLSPRKLVHDGDQSRRTTNMGVLPPQQMMDFPVNTCASTSQPNRGGTWEHSLCSCAEPSICMTGIFCPCILYGRTQYRLARRSEKKDPTNMLGYSSVNGSCLAWSILCGINGILSGLQKGRIRRSYEMESGAGNFLSDCLEGCCCCCCVLAQGEKEVKHREEGRRNLGGGATETQTAYIPPAGMTFSLPPR